MNIPLVLDIDQSQVSESSKNQSFMVVLGTQYPEKQILF